MLFVHKLKSLLSPKRTWIVLVVLLLVLFVIVPYAKVLVLSHYHADEFMHLSCNTDSDPIEVKVYDYKHDNHAECLVLLDNGMYCVMAEYEWDSSQNEWRYVIDSCVWTRYGGNAHKFYWPMFYWKEFLFS